ncbi:MAG TPA: G/U mismatch-specific DNA glycosylase [Acidimicrobiales bacterium]|nr:G/U mismatch-specific DNA glycosylase [Acidimicrobiales bacterium]
MPTGPRRPAPSPGAAPVAAAGGEGLVPDVIGPDLDVLFCGINPGRLSGATGHHFAHPGNRFWKALEASGFTDRRLRPDQQHQMLDYGLGITNLAGRTTATAAELTRDELRDGAAILEDKVARYRPKVVAFLGLTAYRTAFRRPRATVGPQEDRLGDARLWVLPNPSGLQATYGMDRIVAELDRLRTAVR